MKTLRARVFKFASASRIATTNAQAKIFFTICRAKRRARTGIEQKRANQ
jgi:hypothetical protein